MPNLVKVNYEQTGESKSTNEFGMRAMQEKAKNPVITADDRLVASFEEINSFYEKNGCEPKKSTDMNERGLFSRLKGIRENLDKISALKKYDKFDLLKYIEV